MYLHAEMLKKMYTKKTVGEENSGCVSDPDERWIGLVRRVEETAQVNSAVAQCYLLSGASFGCLAGP